MKITLPALATGLSAFAIASALVTSPIRASETQTSDGVGEAVAVIDQANISGEIGDRKLAVGARVFMGDLIKTDGAGEAQLLFADETRMVVGPNSSLIIDEFVFRNEASVSKFAVRALGGAFRFVTGKSEKESYSIRTPSATIGVRGTAFDFTVDPSGQTDLVLFHGAAHICGAGGSCKTLVSACDLAVSPVVDPVEIVDDMKQKIHGINHSFPYVQSQSSLRDDFQVSGVSSCGDSASLPEIQNNEQAQMAVEVAAAPPPPPPPPPADDPPPPPPAGDGNNGIGNDDAPDSCRGGGCEDDSNPGNAGGNSGNGNAGGNSSNGNDGAGAAGADSDSGGNNGNGNGGGNNGNGGGNNGNGNGRGGRD